MKTPTSANELNRRKQIENSLGIGIFEWNIETGDFWWSAKLRQILDVKETTEQPTLQTLIGFIHPEDQNVLHASLEKLTDDHCQLRLATQVLTSTGRPVPVMVHANYDADTHLVCGYIQDQTQEYAERASLIDTLSKYRGVMESAGDAIVLISQNGAILEGNAKAAELFEVAEDDIPRLSVDNIHAPEDLETMMGHYQGMLWGQNSQVESTIIGQSGRRTIVEITGRPVKIASEEMIVVIFHDVTLQYQAQNALKRSEKRYRSLVDEAREGIMLLDSESRILAVNPKICETLQHKRHELLGKLFCDIADFDLEVSPVDILSNSPHRQSIHMEGNLQSVEGALHPTGFNVARFEEQGQTQFIVTAYDLTDVRLEDAEENEYYKKNLQHIFQAAQRARRLVARILDYTRPEDSEFIALNLREEIAETLELLRSSVPHTITIKENYSDKKFPCMADPDQIHQIVMNVGTNAAQAIGERNGHIDFSLSCFPIDEHSDYINRFEIPEGTYAKLCVTDTGPGIDEAYLNEIFDPFFTTKSQTDGSGLGLSVVERIVRNHGGFVTAQNIDKGGACLSIYLPLMGDCE
jgi:PAS domain S-box-containing protein